MIFKNQTIDALFAVMISILVVMGAFTFTIVEDRINYFLAGRSVFSNEPGVPGSLETPTPTLEDISDGTQTTPDITEVSSLEANATPDLVSTKISDMETKIALAPECTIRKGWELYLTREGDSLEKLARARGVTPPILQIGNCLAGNELTLGEILYLPPMEGSDLAPTFPEGTGEALPGSLNGTPTPSVTASPSPVVCIHPEGWEPYTIAVEDTIPNLSERLGVSIFALQTANCLKTPLVVKQGDVLYVPGATAEPTNLMIDQTNITTQLTPIP